MKKIISLLFSIGFLMVSVVPFSAIPNTQAAAKKVVLIELFTAEWCGYCPDANQRLDKWYADTMGKDFIYIKEHISDDLENNFTRTRATNYGVTGIPSTFMDGEKFTISNESDSKARLGRHAAMGTDASIKLEGKIEGSKAIITADYSGAPSGSELNIVLTEDFSYFPCSNGEKFHRFLARDGKVISTNDSGKETVEFTIQPNWTKEFLNCIAFIGTKSIVFNAQFHSLNNPKLSNTKDLISILPNELTVDTVKVDQSLESEIKLTNAGKIAGKATLSCKDSFIELSEASVEVKPLTQMKVPFQINPGSLQPGKYMSKIEVKTSLITKIIPVEFTILPKPKLFVSTKSLDFGTMPEGEKDTKKVDIKNMEVGPIDVNMTCKAKWIQFSKRSFVANSESITITCNTRGLESGEYDDEIKITSDGGSDTISVHVTVVAPKVIMTPSDFDFGKYYLGKDLPTPKTFALNNEGQADAVIEVKQVPEYVTMDCKSEFTLKPGQEQNIQMSLVADKLSKVGTYSEKLILDYGTDKIEVSVTVVVEEAPPQLQVQYNDQDVEKIALEIPLGEKKSIELVTKNIGAGKLEATIGIKPATPGITVSTTKYSLLANGKKTINVEIDTTKMKAGICKFSLEVKTNGGNQVIPFEVNVIRDEIVIKLQIGSKKAIISGNEVAMEAAPFIDKTSGRTLIPIRIIVEAIDGKIEWDAKTSKVTIIKDAIKIELWIGKPIANVNGVPTPIDVQAPKLSPMIVNGRTFLPLRFVSENLGAEVGWDGATQTITITY